MELDLSNPSAVVDLFEQTVSRFGYVDLLVNNAAQEMKRRDILR
jgi:NAD(P)-dependent dehydrogenase (short-subunit alcohol dehydrogenase family)